MSECSHPYDHTVKSKVQPRYNNIPMNQVDIRVCEDCGTIIDLDGRHGVDGMNLTIGRANSGCGHNGETKSDEIDIVDLSTDTVILSVEAEICTECNRPVESFDINLREATS